MTSNTENTDNTNIEEYILVCSCFNQEKRASEAFAIRHPDKVLPPIIKGRDRIYKFAKERNNDHLEAISKLTGKYAYYITLQGDKIITEEELTTGRRTR